MPFVTNHRYRIHWDNNLEIDQVYIDVSDMYSREDWPIIFNTNYTEVREAVVVQSMRYGEPFEIIANGTLLTDSLNWGSGDHVLYNDPR